jgi:quinol monooxygenase YgiN
MSVIVVADIELVAGEEDAALAALEVLCEQTHEKDPGCVFYAVHRDTANPAHLVMIEKWDSAEALSDHREADHIAAFREAPGLASASVSVLEGLDFGTADKGSL